MFVRTLNYSVIFFHIIFSVFSLILPKPSISEALKSLHAEKKINLNSEGFKFNI